jgi:putative copper export protein
MALGAGAAAFTSAAIYRLSGVTVLASLAMAASFALTGHAQGVTAPLLTPIAVAAHVVCAGFWIAAPITLWPSSAIADDLLAARARRFSSLALAFVTVLFVLGGALALRLSGSVNALISSFYGQLLVAKLATATGALGLGAYNKMVVTNALETNPIRGRSMLMRALLADGLLFAAALLLVGWATTMTGPPDAV